MCNLKLYAKELERPKSHLADGWDTVGQLQTQSNLDRLDVITIVCRDYVSVIIVYISWGLVRSLLGQSGSLNSFRSSCVVI